MMGMLSEFGEKREKNLHKRDSMKRWHRMKREVQLFYVFST